MTRSDTSTPITEMLAERLPVVFRGYPVAFEVTRDPGGGAWHRVEVTGLGGWLARRLGFDPRGGVTPQDWLATPYQRLAEVTAGAVFHDDPGELSRVRAALSWYPQDVWLYVLSCQWRRISQEEAFPGRCAEAGDELGSAVVIARLARDLMCLWLLMNRRYPPYSKWLGSAFARVPGAAGLGASLAAALSATAWPRPGAASEPGVPGRRRSAQRARAQRTSRHQHPALLRPAVSGPGRRALRRRPGRRDHGPGDQAAAAHRRR